MRFIVWGVEKGESEVHWGSRKYESSITVINLGNLQGDMWGSPKIFGIMNLSNIGMVSLNMRFIAWGVERGGNVKFIGVFETKNLL
jgi:hypothetical protein